MSTKKLNLETLENRVLLSVDLPVEAALVDGSVYEGDFDSINDTDSFSFQAEAGKTYHIRCESRGTESIPDDGSGLPELYEVTGYTDPVLTLYGPDGNTVITSDDDSGIDSGAYIEWTAEATGTYYFQAEPFQNSLKNFEPGEYSVSLTEGNADWTIMMYYSYDNNLERTLTSEITNIIKAVEEATTGGIVPSVNIVALTDGSADYDYSELEFELDGNTIGPFDLDWYESTIYWSFSPYLTAVDVGEKNCGDPDTLTDFVDWAMELYPADNYSLFIGDHGGQYYGMCWDEGSDDDHITMDEVSDLSKHMQDNNINIDLMVMETCLLAGIEPAYQFAEMTDYYLASEPTTWGSVYSGHEYNVHDVFSDLFAAPASTPEELGNIFLDNFMDMSDEIYQGNPIAHEIEYAPSAVSLADTSKLDALVDTIDVFSDYMLNDADDNDWLAIDTARRDALQLEDMVFYNRFCDLGDLMEKVQEYSDNPELITIAGSISDAIDDAIVNIIYDRHAKDATGLTISMPLPEQLDSYTTISDLYSLITIKEYDNTIDFLQETSWDRFLYNYLTRDFSSLADSYADSIETAAVLATPGRITGSIDTITDKDFYEFTAVSGIQYSIRCDSIGDGLNSSQTNLEYLHTIFGTTDPQITIYDSYGNILASDDDSGVDLNAMLSWTAPEDGTYYICVDTYQQTMSPFAAGEYTLTVKEEQANWTVMLYMAVDNNLSDAINEEIYALLDAYQETLSTDIWDNINIVAFTDGYGSEENSFTNSIYWQIAPALAGEDMGELDSGDPVTFVDFVEWAETNYPADNYLLIDYNHGGNLTGMDWDDTSDSNISPADFTYISEQIQERGLKIDVFDFSMCVMAGVEIAYQGRDIADYLVAAEPPTLSNDYIGACDNIYGQVSAIADNINITPYDLAKTLVDLYREDTPYVNNELNFLPDSTSMIDTSNIESLVEAIDSFSKYIMTEAKESDWQAINEARNNAINFYPGEDWYYNAMIDLGQFVSTISQTTNNTELKQLADNILDAHQLAVPYNATDANVKDAWGLTIYLPEQDAEFTSIYYDYATNYVVKAELDFSYDTSWDNFVTYYATFGSIAPACSLVDIPTGGVTFFDSDGTKVNIKLNKGDGFIYFNGDIEEISNTGSKITVSGSDLMMNEIILKETTPKSTLKISTSGGTENGTELSGINDDYAYVEGSSLKSISAPGVNLTGDIDIDGWLGSVKLNSIGDGASILSGNNVDKLPNKPVSSININNIGNDVTIDLYGILKSLTANECHASRIAAYDIGTVKIANSGLTANIYSYIGDIQKVIANGDISGQIFAYDEIGRIINRSGKFTGSARGNIGLSQYNFTDQEIE